MMMMRNTHFANYGCVPKIRVARRSDLMKTNGNTILITGGGSGIARAFAAAFHNITVVLHGAGIMRAENLLGEEADLIRVESTIATTLLGPMRLNAALLQHLLKQRDGAVLTIPSGLAFLPMAITPTYCATKAAIHSYSQSLRYQLRSTKLHVVEIIPPYVRTGLMAAGQAADERAMPLDDFINETMAIIKSHA